MEKEGITIVRASSEHSDQVVELLRHSFFLKEPITAAIGLSWQEIDDDFWVEIREVLKQDYSFVALNQSGRVIGCRLSTVMEIPRGNDPETPYLAVPGDTEKHRLAKRVFDALMTGWTKELLDCKIMFKFIMVCVQEEYGGKGIAQELIKKSLELAKETKADYVYAIGTNFKTQRVFDKCGFQTIRTRMYDEFRDEQGKPALNMKDGNKCIKWVAKKLK